MMVHIQLVTRKPAAKRVARVAIYRKLARRHMQSDVVSKFIVLKKY